MIAPSRLRLAIYVVTEHFLLSLRVNVANVAAINVPATADVQKAAIGRRRQPAIAAAPNQTTCAEQ
jgi:hypothetical protein